MRYRRSSNNFTIAMRVAIAAIAAAAGCSEGKAEEGKPPSAAKAVANKPADLSAIQTSIPDELKGELQFKAATLEDGDLAAVVPAGWDESRGIPGRYRPGQGSELGFMTDYKVGTNCDGACTPKDWKEIATRVEFGQFEKGDQFTVDRDEELDNGRLLVAHSDRTTYLVMAWWKQGASRYFYCRASLAEPAAKAIDAFEQACRSTRIINW